MILTSEAGGRADAAARPPRERRERHEPGRREPHARAPDAPRRVVHERDRRDAAEHGHHDVRGAGHRQELGQTLYDRENEHVEN